MSTFHKIHGEGNPAAAAVGEAKLRALAQVDAPFLQSRGPGYVSKKAGAFESVRVSRPGDDPPGPLYFMAGHTLVALSGQNEDSFVSATRRQWRGVKEWRYKLDADGTAIGSVGLHVGRGVFIGATAPKNVWGVMSSLGRWIYAPNPYGATDLKIRMGVWRYLGVKKGRVQEAVVSLESFSKTGHRLIPSVIPEFVGFDSDGGANMCLAGTSGATWVTSSSGKIELSVDDQVYPVIHRLQALPDGGTSYTSVELNLWGDYENDWEICSPGRVISFQPGGYLLPVMRSDIQAKTTVGAIYDFYICRTENFGGTFTKVKVSDFFPKGTEGATDDSIDNYRDRLYSMALTLRSCRGMAVSPTTVLMPVFLGTLTQEDTVRKFNVLEVRFLRSTDSGLSFQLGDAVLLTLSADDVDEELPDLEVDLFSAGGSVVICRVMEATVDDSGNQLMGSSGVRFFRSMNAGVLWTELSMSGLPDAALANSGWVGVPSVVEYFGEQATLAIPAADAFVPVSVSQTASGETVALSKGVSAVGIYESRDDGETWVRHGGKTYPDDEFECALSARIAVDVPVYSTSYYTVSATDPKAYVGGGYLGISACVRQLYDKYYRLSPADLARPWLWDPDYTYAG